MNKHMPAIKKALHKAILITGLSLTFFVSSAQKFTQPPAMSEDWTKDYKPFRIAGNLYYVGTYDLACYLITTPKGHILINTGLAESVPMIRSHVEALGFKFSDIRILLATHAHHDHVGGMADIKKLTGAKMMMNEYDAPVLADGGNSDYSFGGKGSTFKPFKADRLLHEQDSISFDDMKIIVLHHPGHTKGASSFLFDVKDEDRTWRVLIANMPSILEQTKLPSMPTYPNVGKDYANTFESLKKQQFDIWLSSHASQFSLHKKHKPDDAYHPEAFIDREGYDAIVSNLEKEYFKRLK
jgi:metallo-beta-lactamase class B